MSIIEDAEPDPDNPVSTGGGDQKDDIAEDKPHEFVHVNEKFHYLEYNICALGITHAFVSLCMLIAYYNLVFTSLNTLWKLFSIAE